MSRISSSNSNSNSRFSSGLPPRRAAAIQFHQMLGQILEAGKVVNRQEAINMRQRRLHAARQRLVFRRTEQRVKPDEPVAVALQAGHLLAQQIHLAPIPTVADEQDDGASSQHPPAPKGAIPGPSPFSSPGGRRHPRSHRPAPVRPRTTSCGPCLSRPVDPLPSTACLCATGVCRRGRPCCGRGFCQERDRRGGGRISWRWMLHPSPALCQRNCPPCVRKGCQAVSRSFDCAAGILSEAQRSRRTPAAPLRTRLTCFACTLLSSGMGRHFLF